MWLFQRRKTKDRLSRYLTPATVERVLNQASPDFRPQTIEVSYILFQLRDGELEQMSQRLSDACRIIVENKGGVWGTLLSCGFATFGWPEGDEESSLRDRDTATRELLSALKAEIRIVCGRRPALLATVTSNGLPIRAPLLSAASDLVSALTQTEFGSSITMMTE